MSEMERESSLGERSIDRIPLNMLSSSRVVPMGDLNKAKMGREPKTTGRESPAPEQIKILTPSLVNMTKTKMRCASPPERHDQF